MWFNRDSSYFWNSSEDAIADINIYEGVVLSFVCIYNNDDIAFLHLW